MADTKISALTALTGANLASGDKVPVVDVSDTTMAASGTDKAMTAAELAIGLAAQSGLTGRLIHLVSYEPGTAQNKTTTSTSLVAVDTTNLRATFTVPASGNVLVRLTARGSNSTSGANVYWGLLEGASQRGKVQFVTDSTASLRLPASIRVTGLTPGATVSLDWAWAVAAGTGNLNIDASGITSGPAVMEVWSAP